MKIVMEHKILEHTKIIGLKVAQTSGGKFSQQYRFVRLEARITLNSMKMGVWLKSDPHASAAYNGTDIETKIHNGWQIRDLTNLKEACDKFEDGLFLELMAMMAKLEDQRSK